MSTEQLARLKRALAAVQGEEWAVKPGAFRVTMDVPTSMGPAPLVVAETFSDARARFIATCDPLTIGELVALAEQALRDG